MADSLVGGIIEFKLNGEIQSAKGDFKYNLGKPKKEPIVGADRVHGFKSTPQSAFIEGEITDSSETDLEALLTLKDATVTLALANGKVIVLKEASYTADGDAQTAEGNVQVRFDGFTAEEVR